MSEEHDFVAQLYFRDWWKPYVGPPVAFEYIGHRDALLEYVKRKGVWQQLLEALGRRISIASLVNDLLDVNLVGSKDKKTIIEEIITIYEKHNANKTLLQWLAQEIGRATRNGRRFTSVSKRLRSETPLSGSDLLAIDSQFIVLEGTICRKDHLAENASLYEAASHSKCTWVICDFPPVGMNKENSAYRGELVLLETEEGFDDIFGDRAPFSIDIGWFPFVTVSGFLNARRLSSEHFPTLQASIVMYRRPLSPEPNVVKLTAFLQRERQHRIFLKTLAARVLTYYLVPSMYRCWGIGYDKVAGDLKEILSGFLEEDRDRISVPVRKLYEEHILKQT